MQRHTFRSLQLPRRNSTAVYDGSFRSAFLPAEIFTKNKLRELFVAGKDDA